MRFHLLSDFNSWYARDLTRAIADARCEPLVLDFRTLTSSVAADEFRLAASDYGGNPHRLNEADAVMVRTMPPGSLEQVVFRMDALGRLAEGGVTVVNSPRAIECAVDKYLTTTKLVEAGLPVPATVTCESLEKAMLAFEQLGRDIVVKPLFGAEGRGIVRLTDEETAFRVFKSLRMTNAVLYLQQFVRHEGFDVRVLTLDGKVLASMKRQSDLDFRTNVTQQGSAVPYEANEEERDLAIRAAAATETRIAGVDILRDHEGRAMVLEVNAVPGWKALARVSGVDVAAALIQSIQDERRNR